MELMFIVLKLVLPRSLLFVFRDLVGHLCAAVSEILRLYPGRMYVEI